MPTAAKDSRVWSDVNYSISGQATRWRIDQRAEGVNEYTYVHYDSLVNIYLRSFNILSIISVEDNGKGWTLRDANINTQVSS